MKNKDSNRCSHAQKEGTTGKTIKGETQMKSFQAFGSIVVLLLEFAMVSLYESVGQQGIRAIPNIGCDRLDCKSKLTSTTANFALDRAKEQGSSGLRATMVTDTGRPEGRDFVELGGQGLS